MSIRIAVLSFLSAILAVVLTQGLTWAREAWAARRTKQAKCAYASLALAVILEKFALNCAERINDNGMFNNSDGHAGTRHTSLPPLGTYPADIEWQSLAPEMAEKVLSFRNEIEIADQSIQFWWEIEEECMPRETDEQCGRCGYRAWLVASELRAKGKLPQSGLRDFAWDFVELLRETNEKRERRLRAEARAA